MATPTPDTAHPWALRWQAVLQWWHPPVDRQAGTLDLDLEPPPESQPSVHWVVTDAASLPGAQAPGG